MKKVLGEVKENRSLGRDFFLLRIEGEFPPSKPGQFAMLSPSPTFEPFLKRPFGILFQEGESLFFLIKKVGRGTHLLSLKRKGEKISLITPLGNGFTPYPGRVLLAGGGTGVVPLLYLARRMQGYTFLYGARSGEEVFLREFPWVEERAEEVIITTEDGSLGRKGVLTQHIPHGDFSMAYVSGPWTMMRRFAEAYPAEAEFSLETIMGCGFGICYGCAVRVRRGEGEKIVRACLEGPVFKKEEIVWTQR